MDSVQPAHPFGRLLDGALRDALDLAFGRDPPCVMRLVVHDQEVPRVRHLAEHVPNIGFVALAAALVDAPFLGDRLVRLPVERVPVADHHLAPAQLVAEPRWHDTELLVVVLGVGRLENSQAAPHGKAGSDHKDILREPGIAGVRHLV